MFFAVSLLWNSSEHRNEGYLRYPVRSKISLNIEKTHQNMTKNPVDSSSAEANRPDR